MSTALLVDRDKARDAAIDWIRPYVLRGDSEEALAKSWMGHSEPRGIRLQIGGYAWPLHASRPLAKLTKIKAGELAVWYGDGPSYIFTLLELIRETLRRELDGQR